MQLLVKIQYLKRYYKLVAQFVVSYKLSACTIGSLLYKYLFLVDPNWTRPINLTLPFVCKISWHNIY